MAEPQTAAVRVTTANGTQTFTPDGFRQYVAGAKRAWSVEKEQLDLLMWSLDGHGAAVTEVLNSLRAQMSGIANAFGIEPIGQQMLSQWEQAWPLMQKQVEQMAQGYHTAVNPGLSGFKALLEKNEQTNLEGFDRILKLLG